MKVASDAGADYDEEECDDDDNNEDDHDVVMKMSNQEKL